jgi:ATP synthase subunit 6
MNIEFCSLYNVYLVKKLIAFIREIFINNLQINNNIFMVIFIFIFFYLAFVNVTGMFPYAVTFTGHLTFTFFVSFSYFIALNLVAFAYQKNNYFCLFLPSGVPEFIIPLIIIIEFMSFFMRMLSLSIRLFANMMAGHTLLKVLTVFAYIIFYYITMLGEIIGISLIILVIFFIISFNVFIAFLQAYVFATLMILYLNDILHIH